MKGVMGESGERGKTVKLNLFSGMGGAWDGIEGIVLLM